VNVAAGGLQLQEDLNMWCDWASRWQMEFSVANFMTNDYAH